jgi:hypothetical protein
MPGDAGIVIGVIRREKFFCDFQLSAVTDFGEEALCECFVCRVCHEYSPLELGVFDLAHQGAQYNFSA